MQTPPPKLTTHRRQRFILWAVAMLQWVAAVMFAGRRIGPRQLRQRGDISVAGLTRHVIKLMIVRAGELGRFRPRPRRLQAYEPDKGRRHILRSLVGARLRRILRHNDMARRIAILISVLRDLDVYALMLAKRMRRRLTRLVAIAPAHTPASAWSDAFAPLLVCADTS